MARGPLFQDTYRPQFSGHETFPLRYGWLKKAFDAVRATEERPDLWSDNKAVFAGEDAIARFGVGKNMVASIRHWATAAGVIEDDPEHGRVGTTHLGRCLFAEDGLDPYMEHPATSWLVHWHLCGRPDKTTWFWTFSHYPAPTFERDELLKRLVRLAKERNWSRVAATTIKSDVACFIRTYVARQPSGKTGFDDALESPLTELGLVKPVGKHGGFRFVRGPHPSLGAGVFCYAVTDCWRRSSSARTLSFEALAHAPGSPGRVFLLEENDLIDRLARLGETSRGTYAWSETAGLKQLIRNRDVPAEAALAFIEADFGTRAREAA